MVTATFGPVSTLEASSVVLDGVKVDVTTEIVSSVAGPCELADPGASVVCGGSLAVTTTVLNSGVV